MQIAKLTLTHANNLEINKICQPKGKKTQVGNQNGSQGKKWKMVPEKAEQLKKLSTEKIEHYARFRKERFSPSPHIKIFKKQFKHHEGLGKLLYLKTRKAQSYLCERMAVRVRERESRQKTPK